MYFVINIHVPVWQIVFLIVERISNIIIHIHVLDSVHLIVLLLFIN